MQATGADILRIACILATRHGIKLLAPVHDAVLIEAPIERIEADVALMQEIMRRASRIVLNANPRGRTSCAPMRRSSATRSVTATHAALRFGIVSWVVGRAASRSSKERVNGSEGKRTVCQSAVVVGD